jgi:hypothetical protein
MDPSAVLVENPCRLPPAWPPFRHAIVTVRTPFAMPPLSAASSVRRMIAVILAVPIAVPIVAPFALASAPANACGRGSDDGFGPPIILPDPTPDPWGSIGSAVRLTPSWMIVGVREKRQLDATRTLQSFGGLLLWPRLSDGRPTGAPQTIWPLAPLRGARFGAALSVDGDHLLVGEPGYNQVGAGGSPAIQRAQGRVQLVDLSLPIPAATDIIECPTELLGETLTDRTGFEFGAAVSLTADSALIGAPGFRLPNAPIGSDGPIGAALLYERAPDGADPAPWSLTRILLDPLVGDPLVGDPLVGDPLGGDVGFTPLGTRFGSAVAIHGSSSDLLIGAPSSLALPSPDSDFGDGLMGTPTEGRVIVFDRFSGATIATLEAPVPTLGDRFGSTILIEGDRALITAPGDECGFGEVHIFQRDPNRGWTHQATLTPPNDPSDGWIGFGTSVAMSGGRVLVGTGGFRTESAFGHRAALFQLHGGHASAGIKPAWALEAILDGDSSIATASPVALDSSGALLGEAAIGFGQMRYLSIPRSSDLDGDGSVGPSDLSILLGAWGASAGGPADLNSDGTIDQADLALLIGAWS